MTIITRAGTVDDIDWLIGELHEFDKFAGYNLFQDEAYARLALKDLLEKHVCFVAISDDGRRLGFIAGFDNPHPFNPHKRCLSEMFWWVSSAHRGTRAGALLLNRFVMYGRQNCHWVTMSLEHCSPVSARHLTKRGFSLRETSYLLEV